MPYTKKQRGLFGSDIARARAGKATRTGMTEEELIKAMSHKRKKRAAKHGGKGSK